MKKKYEFYKNKRTKYHPAIEVDSNDTHWQNLEVTSSPTKTNRYIKLKKNPNPNMEGDAYVRKYVRNDPIQTRGQLLKKYNLSEDDLCQIEEFLKQKK